MTAVDRSDPQWLQRLFDHAVAERWCVRINCTTCASEEFRHALGLLDRTQQGRARFLPMTREIAEAIVSGLAACAAHDPDDRIEEAARWVIYEVWRTHRDAFFDRLSGTWAGTVLENMRSHYVGRLKAREIHEARQGVKQRDWKR